MPRLSISLLGPFRVTLDGQPIGEFPTEKVQALLAYLSVEADRAHPRQALADLLWPDRSAHKSLQSLRQALYHLRHALGDRDAAEAAEAEESQHSPFLLVTRRSVQFNTGSDHSLDVATFTTLAEACRVHRHRHRGTCRPCLRRMEQMVGLYRGEFLQQFTTDGGRLFEEWILLKQEWLHREAMEALALLADHHERRGELDLARRYARRQVQMEPWREEAHRQLMRLLALDGQRSAALAQYKICRQTLARELGVEPTHQTTVLYESIRTGETTPLLHRPSAPRHNLPRSPTPFVGRQEDLAQLAELLANPDCRLVTLVGPGGVGKTRLALQSATDQIGNFSHGITFVPLSAVGSLDMLVSATANALGVSFREGQDHEQQILNYLRQRELLLVLDGMEHILEGADWVAKILHHAPGVSALVASRERLHLREEWVHPLEGLPYPERWALDGRQPRPVADGATRTPVNPGEGYGAIELFRQQASRVHRSSSLSVGEMPYVVRICQLVDGLPLGVELAAAWSGVRSCREIARELEQNLDVLSTTLRNVPPRQRSIRATFDHSWHLLPQEEKDLLARLSVFRGGFDGDAALQVTGSSRSTLLNLANKSLIHRVAPDRYDMHGLLRRYAAEKLRARPQMRAQTEVEHARYFAALLQQRTGELRAAKGQQAFASLNREIENARQAWEVAVAQSCTRLIEQSLESLYLFYDLQCRFQEGIELLAGAIDRWADDPQGAPILGKLVARQGALYLRLGLLTEARAALQQGLAISRRLNTPLEQTFCLVRLAGAAYDQGEYEASQRLSRKSLSLAREVGDDGASAQSLLSLGSIYYRTGDVGRAERALEKSLAIARASGNARLVIPPLNVLGDIACHRGDYVRGLAVFRECLALSQELGHDFQIAVILNNLGTVFHVLGRYEEAQAAYQESLEICSEIGDLRGEAIALSNLGEVAYAAGAYTEAERLYRRGLTIGRETGDPWTVMACLNNLGETACALGDDKQARLHFTEALTVARDTQTVTMLLKVLVNLAVVLITIGQYPRAAELLLLVRDHPASEQAIQDKATGLLDQMDLVLPDAASRSLETVVAEVLAQSAAGEQL